MQRVVFSILFLAFASSAPAQSPAADAAAEIARSAADFSRALEAGDAATMAAQYTEDATLIPPTAGSSVAARRSWSSGPR